MNEVPKTPEPSVDVVEVMAEISEEVRLRRADGDEFAARERELQELFLAHAPASGRGGELTQALERVDMAMFVDPVVPVESNQKGGAVLKKGMRSALLWYIGWLTHQITQFSTAVSRSLHIVERRLVAVERNVVVQRVPYADVVEFDGRSGSGAWWAQRAIEATVGGAGRTQPRILHAAGGDGWLVRLIVSSGGDAYGVDPRADRVALGELETVDVRSGEVAAHLQAVATGTLGAVVISGVVEGMAGGERDELLALVGDALAPDGVLVIHSVTLATWQSEEAPVEADLSPGHPLRGATWCHLLDGLGYTATFEPGPDGADYVVTAIRRSATLAPSS